MTKSTGSGAGSTGPVEIMSEALSVADVLDRAADLIEPEGAWTRGTLARDATGHSVLPDDPQAVCFCMEGACMRVAGGGENPACGLLEKATGRLDYGNWNDAKERTQAEVVAKLREAAAKAREQSA